MPACIRSVLPECSPRDNLCALCFSCCRRVDSIAAVSAPHNAAAAAATTTIAKANNSDNIKHKTRNTKHVKRIAICATSWRMPRTHRCAACEEMREQVWGKGWHGACDSGFRRRLGVAWERLKPPAQCRQLAKLFDIVYVLGQIAAGLRWIPRYPTGFCRKAKGGKSSQ